MPRGRSVIEGGKNSERISMGKSVKNFLITRNIFNDYLIIRDELLFENEFPNTRISLLADVK